MKPRQPAVRKARSTSGPDLDPEQEPQGLLSARSVGVGVGLVGTPAGIGIFHPALGVITVGIEVMVALTIIGTALFGSQALSERAFRLLRWLGNRPEPPSPTPSHPGGAGPLSEHPGPPPNRPGGAGPLCEHAAPPSAPDGAGVGDVLDPNGLPGELGADCPARERVAAEDADLGDVRSAADDDGLLDDRSRAPDPGLVS